MDGFIKYLPYILSVVGVILIIIVVTIIIELNKNKKREFIKNLLQVQGDLIEVKEKSHNYVLNTNQRDIYIKVLYIGPAREFSINSKRHWQIKNNSKSHMLQTGGFELIKEDKALIVFPTPKKILKYINENEVVFVKPDEKCFDFYLFTIDEVNQVKDVFK